MADAGIVAVAIGPVQGAEVPTPGGSVPTADTDVPRGVGTVKVASRLRSRERSPKSPRFRPGMPAPWGELRSRIFDFSDLLPRVGVLRGRWGHWGLRTQVLVSTGCSWSPPWWGPAGDRGDLSSSGDLPGWRAPSPTPLASPKSAAATQSLSFPAADRPRPEPEQGDRAPRRRNRPPSGGWGARSVRPRLAPRATSS